MPLRRERVFEFTGGTDKIQVSIHTSLEDVFGSLMQDNPTRGECQEMISEILKEYAHPDEKEYKYIMGYVEELI